MQRYKSVHTGAQIDSGVERALPGGAIDAALAGKAAIAKTLTNKDRFVEADEDITTLDFGTYQCNGGYTYTWLPPGLPGDPWGTLSVIRSWEAHVYVFAHARSQNWDKETVLYISDDGVNWTRIANTTPPTEYDLPLSNVTGTVKYSKSQDSKVLITSLCVTASAALSAGATIATLPAGYYPPWEIKMLADIGGQLGRVIISTAGVVTINKTAAQGAEICTGSISFVAAS